MFQPLLEGMDAIQVAGHEMRVRRLRHTASRTQANDGIALLLLQDVKQVLTDSGASEQAILSRLNRLQKRFFTFEELSPNYGNQNTSPSGRKSVDLTDSIIKQIKTSSRTTGLWFVTVDAALKTVFKYAAPQDAIRIALDLSPLLAGAYTFPIPTLFMLFSIHYVPFDPSAATDRPPKWHCSIFLCPPLCTRVFRCLCRSSGGQ